MESVGCINKRSLVPAACVRQVLNQDRPFGNGAIGAAPVSTLRDSLNCSAPLKAGMPADRSSDADPVRPGFADQARGA
jgi:hypothetical protein